MEISKPENIPDFPPFSPKRITDTPVKLDTSDRFIELQALMAERDGMTENQFEIHNGNRPPFTNVDFLMLAEKMRSLKR